MALLLLGACGKGDKPPAPTSGTPNSKPETGPGHEAMGGGGAEGNRSPSEEAHVLFDQVCATCHGANGDGKGQVDLPQKPQDYTNAEWQAKVTDDEIKKIIVEGGAALGKSPMMPAQAQLKDKPEVVAELVKIIRGFKK
ncbi:MAG TPA: cytochrome c [Kofleriaceae bacterium]